MAEAQETVTAVHIYPIKSCQEATIQGDMPTELEVGLTGFRYGTISDRGFVIVEADGEDQDLFVSQRGWNSRKARKHPSDSRLATVEVNITDENTLVVKAAGHGTLTLCTDDTEWQRTPGVAGNMFDKKFYGLDQGAPSAEFFSGLLDRQVKLLRIGSEYQRQLKSKYCRQDAANRVAGADGFPFLWTRQKSLDYLHDAAGMSRGTIPLERYRANIESSGEYEPFAEDFALRVVFGGLAAYVVKPCARCPIPDIDQKTGIPDGLSRKLLTHTRRGWRHGTDTGAGAQPFFGQNLNHIWRPDRPVTVSVGDTVTIREKADVPNVVLKAGSV